ncbi:expressed unknown protein (Partial), partial [Seminavis robusta]|eukprot:Sro2741_g336020.1 n/a (359) ;mRNA; r:390-1466
MTTEEVDVDDVASGLSETVYCQEESQEEVPACASIRNGSCADIAEEGNAKDDQKANACITSPDQKEFPDAASASPDHQANGGPSYPQKTTAPAALDHAGTDDEKASFKAMQHEHELQDTLQKNQKRGKEQSPVVTRVNQDGDNALTDLFVSEVQPLPTTSAASRPRGPGAHAMPGSSSPPPMLLLRAQESLQSQRTQVTVAEEQESVIHDVQVVDAVQDSAHFSVHASGMFGCGDPSSTHFTDLENGGMGPFAEEEVIDAKILHGKHDEEEPQGSWKAWLWMFAAFLLLLIVLIVTLVVVVPRCTHSGNTSPEASPWSQGPGAPPQDCPVKPPFQEGIPLATVRFLSDPKHPHCFANNW